MKANFSDSYADKQPIDPADKGSFYPSQRLEMQRLNQPSSFTLEIFKPNIINITKHRKRPVMPANTNPPKQQVPYSLLAELYRSWEEYRIPAVFYHYTLSILPSLERKKQMLLMSKQIKTLKSNTHIYHRILNSIEARERSLEIIVKNLPILFRYQSTTEMEWPQYDNKDLDFGGKGYKVIHEDEKAGILSPRVRETDRKRALSELINHIRMYQKVTIQIIYLIAQWSGELIDYGYKESIVHFQYHKQDYMLTITKNTAPITDQYSDLFENNPFFIMKKVHEKTQFALIFTQLKPPQEIGARIYECLNLLSDHQAKILKFRMLAKVSQTANKYRRISKSTDIHKIYGNFNHGNDYIVVKDAEMNKRSRVVADPPQVNSRLLKQMSKQEHMLQSKLKSRKSISPLKNIEILINPEFKSNNDKTIRKNPVILNSDFMGIAQEADETVEKYLSAPLSPPLMKKSIIQEHDLRNSQKLQLNNKQFTPYSLQRSKTDENLLKKSKSASMGAQNLISSQRMSEDSLMESISVRNVHGKNVIGIGGAKNLVLNDRKRNKGYAIQRKMQVFNEIDQQKVFQQPSLPQIRKDEHLKEIKLFNQRQQASQYRNQFLDQSEIQMIEPPTNTGELSQNSQLTLIYEQNIKQTQIVKHLRNKVFNNSQTNQSTTDFAEIQDLAKKILIDKDFITFIRVQSKGLRIAWLAVKFLQRDTLTMKRAVMIIYIRKFLKLTNFEHKLLDTFVAYGYGVIRNQNKILYEIDIVDVVHQPLVKIKYKVSVTSQKQAIKATIKSNKSLLNSRLLKYYYYSKNSKYHKHCDHTHPNICSLSFNFKNVYKVSIDKMMYVVGRADKITCLNQDEEFYKIHSIANDGLDCLVSKTLTSILSLEKEDQIDRDSSFDSKMETQYKSIAIREAKIMRKYVESIDGSSKKKKYQYQQTVVSEFITVNNRLPEVRSIMKTRQDAIRERILIVDAPFFMAIASNEEGQMKTLAILEFQ